MTTNPMNKMFSGKKYTEPSNEPKIPIDEKNMDIKELEKFYKRVRDVQLNEIRELIIKLNREGDIKLDKIVIKLNDFINRDVVNNVEYSLQNYKTELVKALDQNYFIVNKRITQFEKFIFIFGLILFFLLIPNVVVMSRWIYSYIKPFI